MGHQEDILRPGPATMNRDRELVVVPVLRQVFWFCSQLAQSASRVGEENNSLLSEQPKSPREEYSRS